MGDEMWSQGAARRGFIIFVLCSLPRAWALPDKRQFRVRSTLMKGSAGCSSSGYAGIYMNILLNHICILDVYEYHPFQSHTYPVGHSTSCPPDINHDSAPMCSIHHMLVVANTRA
jgi:hypothetical protein